MALRLLKRKWILIGLAAAVVVAVVAGAVGRACLPGYVQRTAVAMLSKPEGVAARLGEIKMRLAAGQVEVGPLAISLGQAKTQVLGWQGLAVDMQTLSLLSGIAKVRDVSVDSPSALIELAPDGSLNLARLAPPSEAEPSKPSEPSDQGLIIGSILVRNGRVTLVDRMAAPEGVRTTIEDIGIKAKVHYNLFGEGSMFCSFAAVGKRVTSPAGRLKLSGAVETGKALQVDSVFELTDISLRHIDPYCKASPISLDGGTADVEGRLRIWKNRIASRFTIQLHDVKVSARKGAVNKVVVGVPAQAALALLRDKSGELPLVVEIEGDLSDPKFSVYDTVMKAIASAFASRTKQLGDLGVAAVAAGFNIGKKAGAVAIDVGAKVGKGAADAARDVGKAAVDTVVDPVNTGKEVGKEAAGAVRDVGKAAVHTVTNPIKTGKKVGAKVEGVGKAIGRFFTGKKKGDDKAKP